MLQWLLIRLGVDAIIAEVKKIIDTADKFGVKINKGNAGNSVSSSATTDATAVLSGGQC